VGREAEERREKLRGVRSGISPRGNHRRGQQNQGKKTGDRRKPSAIRRRRGRKKQKREKDWWASARCPTQGRKIADVHGRGEAQDEKREKKGSEDREKEDTRSVLGHIDGTS